MYRGVAIITHEFVPFSGGMATYANEMARELVKRGIEVEVIAPEYEVDSAPVALPYPVTRALHHHRLTLVGIVKAVRAILRQPADRFLHASDIRAALLLLLVRLMSGRRFGVMIHGSEVSKLGGRSVGARISRIAYQSADVIFSNSQATLDIYRKYGGDNVPGRVTFLGIDKRWFSECAEGFEHRELSELDRGAVFICTVGRIERRKGHDDVIRAMALWSELRRRLVTYVVAGPVVDEVFRNEIEALAIASGIRVIFAGRLSEADLRVLYFRCAAHVLAAVPLDGKVEGFGFVLLEAGAQGAPSVATCVGGIPEVVIDNVSGLLVLPGDVAGISRALENILDDASLREKLGRAAKARAASFTWGACVDRTYRDIVAGVSDC